MPNRTTNRAERRRLEREGERVNKEPRYMLSKQEIIDTAHEQVGIDMENMARQILTDSTKRIFNVFVVALHDKEGFGQKRIQRVLERADDLFNYIDSGAATLEEIQKLAEEIGVVVK